LVTRVALYELPYFVRNILAVLMLAEAKDSATILALEGNLGAGKTTFVQTLAQELGVREVVQSPTYVLMKNYPLELSGAGANTNKKFTKLVHIDAYRLESPEEFDALRPQEFLGDPRTLVVVEWPQKLEGKLPKPDMTIAFSADDMTQDERDIAAV
jgi:tRNA threonylcarbamoyladenosine biosynthesis protein TsaE